MSKQQDFLERLKDPVAHHLKQLVEHFNGEAVTDGIHASYIQDEGYHAIKLVSSDEEDLSMFNLIDSVLSQASQARNSADGTIVRIYHIEKCGE